MDRLSEEIVQEVVYTPASLLRNPRELKRRFLEDLLASRELGLRLLIRNLNARYRQTLLGYVWAFLPPLATMAIWVVLNAQSIVEFDTGGIPYAAFVLSGLVLWQTFVDAIQTPLRVAEESKAMLAKINFPREALLLTAVGETVFGFLVRVVLLVGVFAWFGLPVSSSIVMVPVGVAALIAMGTMIGVLLIPPGLLYQDFSRGLVLMTQLWLYATPVVYPPVTSGILSRLNWLNPVSPLLLATRDWLLNGTTAYGLEFVVVVLLTGVLLLVGLIVYRLAIPILIERMAA